MLNCLAERGTSNNFGVIAVHQVKGLMFIPTCGGMYGWGTVPRKNGEDLADASARSLAAETSSSKFVDYCTEDNRGRCSDLVFRMMKSHSVPDSRFAHGACEFIFDLDFLGRDV